MSAQPNQDAPHPRELPKSRPKPVEGLTYARAGVNRDAANRAVELVKARARSTFRPEVLGDIGSFSGLFHLQRYRDPVLVSSTDGVGTKLKVACALDKHDTIGIDLVNHCVNDALTCGGQPLFFLDYFAAGRLVPEQLAQVVEGIAQACQAAGCALIGGETAEMPGLYPPGEYDLVGFIVAVVEREAVIDGHAIVAGDVLLGLPSSGLHTNGYSLVRHLFGIETRGQGRAAGQRELERFYPELGRTLGEELLQPHRCYWPTLKPVLAPNPSAPLGMNSAEGLPLIKGMAHITGGGLPENLPRVLPEGLAANLRKGSWPLPPIFSLIQRRGNIDQEEMERTFNMGLGMVLVCAPERASQLLAALPEARPVGEVVEQRGPTRVGIE